MTPRRVAFVGFEGLTALDLVGPAEAFASAFLDGPETGRRRCYEVLVLGLSRKLFVAESGIAFKPGAILESAGAIDTLIIPGAGARRLHEAFGGAGAILRAPAVPDSIDDALCRSRRLDSGASAP